MELKQYQKDMPKDCEYINISVGTGKLIAEIDSNQVKSLYEPNGLKLNDVGLKLSNEVGVQIESIYEKYVDMGYSPFEIREVLLTQIFHVTAFFNAMRGCDS